MPRNANYCAFLLALYAFSVSLPTKAQRQVKLPLHSYLLDKGCTIRGYVSVPTTQKAFSRTFKFTITLENDSSSAVSILNPFDLIDYLLLNKNHKQSLFLQEHKIFRERGSIPPPSVFYATHLLLNGKAYSFDYKNSQHLVLPAHGKFSATINVLAFLNTDAPEISPFALKNSTNSSTLLRKGKYRFKIDVGIIQNKKLSEFQSAFTPVIID